MTHNEALDIATSNAMSAIDQDHAYPDSVASYRQNLIDTLSELNGGEHMGSALHAFDAYILQHRVPVSTKSNLVYCVIQGSGVVVAIYPDRSDAHNLLLEMCHLFPELNYSISCSFVRLRADQSLTGL